MQFNIKQKYFLDSLRILSGIVEKSDDSHSSYASNVLLNLNSKYLILITHNKEIELKVKLKNLFIIKTGAASINFNKLYSICKNFDKSDLIFVNSSGEKIEIISFNSKYLLSSYDVSKFPLYGIENTTSSFKVDKIALKEMINKISFSMGIQDVRFFLNGMLLDFNKNKITLVSTDGYRLSKVDLFLKVKHVINKKIILPRQSIVELYKILSYCEEKDVIFHFGNTYLKINIGKFNYRTKLLSGNYPNYNNFIPKINAKFIILNSLILKKMFLRISVLCNLKSNKVLLSCTTNKLVIKTLNFHKDKGKEEMFINYIGEKVDISFNIKYVMDILSKIDSTVVEISLKDATSSVIFREIANKQKYSSLYVLMPVRI